MPVYENVWSWSSTAADNASADGSINWVEGQDPATVNNSARSMMAAIRKFAVTIGGNNIVAGTGNAITITTSVGIDAANITYGFRICFIAYATNTGAATVAIDGLSPVAIKRNNGDDLVLGDIRTGGIYDISFDGVNYKLLGAGPSLGTYGTLTGNNSWTGTNGFSGAVYLGQSDDYIVIKGQPVSPFIADMFPKGDAAAVRAYLGISTTNDVGYNSVTTTGDVTAAGYLRSNTGLLLGGVNPFNSELYEQGMLNTLTKVDDIVVSAAGFPPGARIPIKLLSGNWGFALCF